jgi:ParB-like nuclease domain
LELRTQQIRMEDIIVPPSRRELRHLDGLTDSVQTVGLLNAITANPEGLQYRIVAGVSRYYVCKRLGWSEIPAVIVSGEALLVELATIDENLMRQELTVLERGEQFWSAENSTADGRRFTRRYIQRPSMAMAPGGDITKRNEINSLLLRPTPLRKQGAISARSSRRCRLPQISATW